MSAELTARVHGYLTGAPTSLFYQQSVEMLEHWSGSDNLLWRVRSGSEVAVVKLFMDAGQARSRRQYNAHTFFAPAGVAPAPLWHDRYPTGLANQLMVYRWQPGHLMAADRSESFAALAGAVALVHNTGPEVVQRFSPHPVNLDYYWRLQGPAVASVRAWLHTLPVDRLAKHYTELADAASVLVQALDPAILHAAPVAVHGDLRLEHVILSDGTVQLLDWEMCGLGDQALDVATFLHRHLAELDLAAQRLWLDQYLSNVRLADLETRINNYRQLLTLHSVTFMLSGFRDYLSQPRSTILVQEEVSALLQTLAAATRYAALAFTLDTTAEAIDHAIKSFGAFISTATA
jgi:thiamine kinase-like enzyme